MTAAAGRAPNSAAEHWRATQMFGEKRPEPRPDDRRFSRRIREG
jgi:hypothetical protein